MTTNTKFPLLLEPGYIGRVKIKNHIIKTGAGTFFPSGDKEDPMNDKVKCFYESIARGGVGLLIVESPIIDYPTGARRKNRIPKPIKTPALNRTGTAPASRSCKAFASMLATI